jgi:hypothetical protein
MKILIDGDSCSVVSLTERIAKSNHIGVDIYCDTTRNITSDYSDIHIVDCEQNSADFAIINHCNPNDIVVTNDGGLAAMVLARHGYVINCKGVEYTNTNIMTYLNSRYIRMNEKKKTKRSQVKGNLHPSKDKRANYGTTLQRMINVCKKEQSCI